MKVGILTFPNSRSYGAALQMYALYHAVNTLGHKAEIINYYNDFMRAERHFQPIGSSDLKYFARRVARRLLHARVYEAFEHFEHKNMDMFPRKFFTRKENLFSVGARYGAVICGSDQVWNPDITGRDVSYFLDFCGEETQRISYAPSFGVETLPDGFAVQAAEELKKFHALSVREEQGRKIVADLTGMDVPVVIDPTMLLDATQWQQLEAPDFAVNEEYVLYYTVKSSPRLFAKCRAFAEKQGLKMIVIGGNWLRRENDSVVRHAVDISPATWLWLVHHARYVVTNSFHGTAFSIIFEKNFYLELSARTNSRLTNIVKMLALEDRILPMEEDIRPSRADYAVANMRLADLKAASLQYLCDALSEGVAYG